MSGGQLKCTLLSDMGKTEKSPGLKILWLWTIGTAAILVASVVTTRLRDMEKVMNPKKPDATRPGADGFIQEESQ